MHSRSFRILLLALVALWYGAILPGHQRGVVQLPGMSSDPCCERGPTHPSNDPAEAPAGNPRTCAVCHYMATLAQAAPPDLAIVPLGLTDDQPLPSAPAPVTLRAVPAYLGRAPPLA